jgi:hypothetical protein
LIESLKEIVAKIEREEIHEEEEEEKEE